jgi:hypothetical protein
MKLFRLTTLALLVAAQLLPVGAQEPPPPALTAELADYTALRAAKLSGEVAAVSNVVLKRDAGTFTLRSGELHFFTPVQGRVTGAVFVGDGEFTMAPPLECEKRAIAIFTREPKIAERFDELVLRFSDETWAEVKESGATFSTGGAHAARAAKLLEENAKLLREKLRTNYALRTFVDVYSKEKERSGYFTAFVKGARFNKLIFLMDPRGIPFVAPEQVALLSYGDADGGIWASFPMSGGAVADARTYDILQHDIVARVDGTKMACTDTLTLRATREGVRVLPFDLFPALRVAKVTDASGAALPFVQQAKDEDAELAVVLPAPLATDADTTLTVEYAGEGALFDAGGGNFMLLPRSTWYPNNGSTAFGDRARFRTTYYISKKSMIVGTGSLAEPETLEGEQTVSKWTSGDIELAVAGFNIGRFKKKELKDEESGYQIEFYANKEVPSFIREMQLQIEQLEAQGVRTGTTLGAISTGAMADSAIADAQNATRIYNAYFGRLPYSRVAMTQQPAANFGQAWPTLIYMPFTAFLDTTIRTQMMGTRGGTDTFWKYVGPHEVAHQWWGHIIGWSSYRDQWMSEGFAEFSASLYVQHVHGMDKFAEFWEAHRKEIVQAGPATEGKPPYTVGPVTQGFRLSSGKTGAVYRFLVYPKGAYILHMLRMLMYSPQTGDDDFKAMMKDFISSHYNKDVSTEDFKRFVDKHMQKGMDLGGNGRMDWFFDQWVYGTEVPTYALEYSLREEGGRTVLAAKLTQSGVSDGFRMQVPIYLDFGKGWSRLGQVALVGNASKEFTVPLPQRPKRVAANALNDVLCLGTTNTGR